MISGQKNIRVGDLVYYTGSSNSLDLKEKVGMVVSINPVLGSGFQTADVLWPDTSKPETVVINYIKPIEN